MLPGTLTADLSQIGGGGRYPTLLFPISLMGGSQGPGTAGTGRPTPGPSPGRHLLGSTTPPPKQGVGVVRLPVPLTNHRAFKVGWVVIPPHKGT
eukprot:46916-Hanusia_phi.AAC.1